MLPVCIRYCWLAICLWDIWGWRFAYHAEVFGLHESQLSWYLTGLFILSLASTMLAVGWGLSRFARIWGFFFWLSYLVIHATSASFQSAGHQLLLIVLPFLFLLPIEDDSPASLRESSHVIRVFTYILALICCRHALDIILAGGFNGYIFDSYLFRDHTLNQWLASHTTSLPWGYCWALFILGISGLLFYGNWRCRTWAAYCMWLWGTLTLILSSMTLAGAVLLLTALLLWQSSWKTIRQQHTPDKHSPIFVLRKIPFRSTLAWALCILLISHQLATWMKLRPLQKVAEIVGYNSQWDPLHSLLGYPQVSLEGRHKGVWKPLIGKQGDRSWNTIEETLLVTPAVSHYPPSALAPELRRRFEIMILRWKIEWGEDLDRYRLLYTTPTQELFILQETPYISRQFEGSRSRD